MVANDHRELPVMPFRFHIQNKVTLVGWCLITRLSGPLISCVTVAGIGEDWKYKAINRNEISGLTDTFPF